MKRLPILNAVSLPGRMSSQTISRISRAGKLMRYCVCKTILSQPAFPCVHHLQLLTTPIIPPIRQVAVIRQTRLPQRRLPHLQRHRCSQFQPPAVSTARRLLSRDIMTLLLSNAPQKPTTFSIATGFDSQPHLCNARTGPTSGVLALESGTKSVCVKWSFSDCRPQFETRLEEAT